MASPLPRRRHPRRSDVGGGGQTGRAAGQASRVGEGGSTPCTGSTAEGSGSGTGAGTAWPPQTRSGCRGFAAAAGAGAAGAAAVAAGTAPREGNWWVGMGGGGGNSGADCGYHCYSPLLPKDSNKPIFVKNYSEGD